MQLEKLQNTFKMDLSDEELPLESCHFLLTHHQEQIKRKRRWMWLREIFKKRIEQGVYHNYSFFVQWQEMKVNDRESFFRLFVSLSF